MTLPRIRYLSSSYEYQAGKLTDRLPWLQKSLQERKAPGSNDQQEKGMALLKQLAGAKKKQKG